MREWQPIETAPKDGSEFLAYDSRAKKMDVAYMYEGTWGYECNAVQEGDWRDPGEFGYDHRDITHWMPLPDPPKHDSRKDQR